jgi:hypothetical protein
MCLKITVRHLLEKNQDHEASETVYAATHRNPNTVHPKHVKLQLPFCSVSLPPRVRFCNSLLKINFSRSNSTKSPASGADNVSEPAGLESARSRLREDNCFCNWCDGVDIIRLIT